MKYMCVRVRVRVRVRVFVLALMKLLLGNIN